MTTRAKPTFQSLAAPRSGLDHRPIHLRPCFLCRIIHEGKNLYDHGFDLSLDVRFPTRSATSDSRLRSLLRHYRPDPRTFDQANLLFIITLGR